MLAACPADPALGGQFTTDFTQGASSDWTLADGTTMSYNSNGANFVIKQASDAPTITSAKYIFFGKISAEIKAAPGTGIISSFILQSDDLDEIDWEWIGGTDSSVQTNFFGKGNTTTYDRSTVNSVTTPEEEWHTYTLDWTSSTIKWYIDNNLIRTVNYGDAIALNGKNYPQTPMRVKIGSWVGCASQAAASNPATSGTCSWAGGPADFSKAPFDMLVKSVTVEDYGCASEYVYGDMSGSYQSIKSVGTCGGTTTTSLSTHSTTTISSTSHTTSTPTMTTTITSDSTTTSSTSSTSTEQTKSESDKTELAPPTYSATTPATTTMTATTTPTSTITIVSDSTTTTSSTYTDTYSATESSTDSTVSYTTSSGSTITTNSAPSYTTYPNGVVTTVPYGTGNYSTITFSGTVGSGFPYSSGYPGSGPGGSYNPTTLATTTTDSGESSSSTSGPTISPITHPGAASRLRGSSIWGFDVLALCLSVCYLVL